MALLVSLPVLCTKAENNPDVFRSLHLEWPPQDGAVAYEIHYNCPGADGPHQTVPLGMLTAIDLPFLIPGLPYWFDTFWIDSNGAAHLFGSRVFYVTPGAGEIGLRYDSQGAHIRMLVHPNHRLRLLASEDLNTWVTLSDNVWTVDGVVEYLDETARPVRFYRTVEN